MALDFGFAAGGEEEGRSARGGNGCSRPIECLRTTGAALSRARETTPAARQIRIHTRDRPSHWRRVGMAASAGARRGGSEEEAARRGSDDGGDARSEGARAFTLPRVQSAWDGRLCGCASCARCLDSGPEAGSSPAHALSRHPSPPLPPLTFAPALSPTPPPSQLPLPSPPLARPRRILLYCLFI